MSYKMYFYGPVSPYVTTGLYEPVPGSLWNMADADTVNYDVYAIRDDGTLWGSGYIAGGGSVNTTFIQISADTTWVYVKAMRDRGCVAVKADGSMWTIGRDPWGTSYTTLTSRAVGMGGISKILSYQGGDGALICMADGTYKYWVSTYAVWYGGWVAPFVDRFNSDVIVDVFLATPVDSLWCDGYFNTYGILGGSLIGSTHPATGSPSGLTTIDSGVTSISGDSWGNAPLAWQKTDGSVYMIRNSQFGPSDVGWTSPFRFGTGLYSAYGVADGTIMTVNADGQINVTDTNHVPTYTFGDQGAGLYLSDTSIIPKQIRGIQYNNYVILASAPDVAPTPANFWTNLQGTYQV